MTRWRSLVRAGWRLALLGAVLLGMLVWTLRLAWAEQGAVGVCVTIGLWVCVGIPAGQGLADRTHGHHPHRTDRW